MSTPIVTSVVVQSPSNPVELVTFLTANPLANISIVSVHDQIYTLFYTLDSQTQVLKTGTLVTTTTTVDQVILTYAVSAGKTLFLTYLTVVGAQTAPAGGTSIVMGVISIETPTGTKVMTKRCLGGGSILPDGLVFSFSTPLFIPTGTVIRAVVTPASTTSFTWSANFGGYEI